MAFTRIILFIGWLASLFSFDEKPWTRAPFHFAADFYYQYSQFNRVDKAVNPTLYRSHENLVGALLNVPIWPTLEVQGEMNFNEAKSLYFSFDSVGFLVKKQFYNDIVGDPLSLCLVSSLVFSPHERISHVVTTLHNMWNFDVGITFGKERVLYDDWSYRWWLFADVGMANQGYPWVGFDGNLEIHLQRQFLLALSMIGYFGTSPRQAVDIGAFSGWGNIGHHSIDFKIGLQKLLGAYGKLGLSFLVRAYAKSYPNNYWGFLLEYHLPFSL